MANLTLTAYNSKYSNNSFLEKRDMANGFKDSGIRMETGLKKFGAILGDCVEVGCGSVLNPGTVVGAYTNIYPLSSVREAVPAHSIYKNRGEVAEKE